MGGAKELVPNKGTQRRERALSVSRRSRGPLEMGGLKTTSGKERFGFHRGVASAKVSGGGHLRRSGDASGNYPRAQSAKLTGHRQWGEKKLKKVSDSLRGTTPHLGAYRDWGGRGPGTTKINFERKKEPRKDLTSVERTANAEKQFKPICREGQVGRSMRKAPGEVLGNKVSQ